MKWTLLNESGSEAKMEAQRLYPEGLNARNVTLLATRKAFQSAERKIGRITHVRLGSTRPFLSEPVVIRIAEQAQPTTARDRARQARTGEQD